MAGRQAGNPIEDALMVQAAALISQRRSVPAPRPAAGPPAGGPRKILLAGYCGAGNAGADIHMGEIIRQLRHLFRSDQVQFAYASAHPVDAAPYADIAWTPDANDLATCLDSYDGVIVCEGSLFKSQFSNAMALSFIGMLGMAAAQRKPGIAYGVEAGAMDAGIAGFARAACQETLIVARSAGSQRLLARQYGLAAVRGTDTAWSFAAGAPGDARARLAAAGWDGNAKVLCVAPVNPFWWPACPDPAKAAAMHASGLHRDLHRTSIFFHRDSPEVRATYDRYLDGIAAAVQAYCRECGAFLILVGMERQDRRHCNDLQARLGVAAPVFASGELPHADLVAVLRCAHIVVSSRYHALVTSMPGSVPGIGITTDERIRNLMAECGTPECVLDAGAPDLGDALGGLLRHVDAGHARYAAALAPFVGAQLRCMDTMGALLCNTFAAHFPELVPIARGRHVCLPPLDPLLAGLLEAQPT